MATNTSPIQTKTKAKLIIAIIVAVGVIAGASLYAYSTNNEFSNPAKQITKDNNMSGLGQFIPKSAFGSIIIEDNSFNFKEEVPKIIENNLIYRNETLGFEIARPDLTWNFQTDMSQIIIEQTGTITNKEFLGGAFVVDPTNQNVFVAVFDISELDENSLVDYVDAQLEWIMANFDAKLKLKEISPNKQWAIFGIEVKQNNQVLYGEQILEIRNDKLYMIQYTGILPEKMQAEKLKEFRIILDSFKTIP
ncbi:MAG: hypothetical protein ACE5Q5_00275 [Nitrosarchaeum sp.]